MSWEPPVHPSSDVGATASRDAQGHWAPPRAAVTDGASAATGATLAPPPQPPPADDGAGPNGSSQRVDAQPTVVEPPRVFISYRRADTSGFVEVLDARLRDDLTSTNVYRDVHDAILGEQFEQRIETEIDRSDAIMVVVGPVWAGPGEGPNGAARIAARGDLVRREVALALGSDNPSAALPILVDGASIPGELPEELQPLTRRTYVETSADEITDPNSAGYQAILVGVWNAKREAVPNGTIVFGGESAKARAVVAEIVAKLQHGSLSDLTEVTRYACNARVLSKRRARRLGRRYPDVIIVVDDESADSPILAARVAEVRRRRLRNVAVVTVGGTLLFGAGAVTGTGGLSQMSQQLGSALTGLEPTKVVNSVSKLVSWRATMSVAGKAAIATGALGTAVVGAVALQPDPDPPSIPLAGQWSVDTFTLDAQGNTVPGDFGPIAGGRMLFEPLDPTCDGDGCELQVAGGPEFLDGATLRPDGDGGYDTDFADDEQQTIRSLTGGGIVCTADQADLVPFSDLRFDARLDDATGALQFYVWVGFDAAGGCNEGFLEWSANATRLAGSG